MYTQLIIKTIFTPLEIKFLKANSSLLRSKNRLNIYQFSKKYPNVNKFLKQFYIKFYLKKIPSLN